MRISRLEFYLAAYLYLRVITKLGKKVYVLKEDWKFIQIMGLLFLAAGSAAVFIYSPIAFLTLPFFVSLLASGVIAMELSKKIISGKIKLGTENFEKLYYEPSNETRYPFYCRPRFMDMFNSDVSTFDLSNAVVLANLSHLSYKKEEDIKSVVEKWDCTVKFIENDHHAGIILTHPKYIIIAFRGTDELKDWTHANFRVTRKGLNIGSVHSGFQNGVDMLFPEIIKEYKHQNKIGLPVWMTGHSLGAAMAALAAYKLKEEKEFNIQGIYTFAQPNTGDIQVLQKL